jgi:hypothetical protein
MENPSLKPSIHYCKTGVLEDDEVYNQNIHNGGNASNKMS